MIILGSSAVQEGQMYRTKECWQPKFQMYAGRKTLQYTAQQYWDFIWNINLCSYLN